MPADKSSIESDIMNNGNVFFFLFWEIENSDFHQNLNVYLMRMAQKIIQTTKKYL